MGHLISVDMGGTTIRAALFQPEGDTPVLTRRTSTAVGPSVEANICKVIRAVWPVGETVAAIGVAAPGPIDGQRGVVFRPPNIPGWDQFPLRQYLEEEFKVMVMVANDANMAAYGEWKNGAGRGYDHLLYLTISTGIGGGIITGGKLLVGAQGMAAELGHVTIDPSGPCCPCGIKGHLEAYASGPSIARYLKEQISSGRSTALARETEITPELIAKAAKKGDKLSIEAFSNAGCALGKALAGFLHIFNPSIIIFGGGVSQSMELFMPALQDSLARHVLSPKYLEGLKLVHAGLGDNTGVTGMMTFLRHNYRGAYAA
jgi:glucokinase